MHLIIMNTLCFTATKKFFIKMKGMERGLAFIGQILITSILAIIIAFTEQYFTCMQYKLQVVGIIIIKYASQKLCDVTSCLSTGWIP